MPKPRRNTINLNKLTKAPLNTVDRLSGEGGQIFNLDNAVSEKLNKLLTSQRNDPYFESKLRAHHRNKSNKSQIKLYMELINRKMKR